MALVRLSFEFESFFFIIGMSTSRFAPAAQEKTYKLLHEDNCLRHLYQFLVKSGKKYGARTALGFQILNRSRNHDSCLNTTV